MWSLFSSIILKSECYFFLDLQSEFSNITKSSYHINICTFQSENFEFSFVEFSDVPKKQGIQLNRDDNARKYWRFKGNFHTFLVKEQEKTFSKI